MRFIAYWLTHGVGAALLGGGTLLFFFGVMNHLATNASSATPAEIAALTQPELEDGVRQLMMTGLTSGLVTAAAVLLGWKLSKPLAFRWTAVVETAEGDAVLHLSALSLEERPKWMTEHPSQQRYRLIIAAFLILSGAVIQPALGTLTDASALAAWVPSPRCRSLQSSAARPATIRQIRPTFDETVEGHKPEISETQPGLFETDLQSSPLAHIP